jgi:flagellar biosynthetic protein FliS
MTYASAAVAYREREVLTAAPGRLVVIVFDQLLVNLRRARFAMDANNIELRAESVGKAREAAMELLVTTDVDRGGAIGQNLRSIYVYLVRELITLSGRNDVAKVDGFITIVSDLRDAFATVATGASARVPAA